MTPQERDDRRRYPRVKAQIPVELLPSGTAIPMRTVTEEISLCRCYIPSMFTLEVGKTLHVTLSLHEERIRASAVVATKFPNIGNGIDFIDMDPNDRMKLHKYIEASKEDAAGNSAPS
jgi:c-di-GMP-binding flagellar brake protein YcgR